MHVVQMLTCLGLARTANISEKTNGLDKSDAKNIVCVRMWTMACTRTSEVQSIDRAADRVARIGWRGAIKCDSERQLNPRMDFVFASGTKTFAQNSVHKSRTANSQTQPAPQMVKLVQKTTVCACCGGSPTSSIFQG
jgi:hypothetical protein